MRYHAEFGRSASTLYMHKQRGTPDIGQCLASAPWDRCVADSRPIPACVTVPNSF